MNSYPQRSVRTLLFWLVLACLSPGVIGAALLFIHQYQEGRSQQERGLTQTARALVQAVDTHLLRVQAAGEALATSDSLARGDLVRFHEQAQKLLKASELAVNVVLRDKSEQLVFNALMQFDSPLPEQPSREHVRRVLSTGKPAISALYRVPQFSHPIISVDVPVYIEGKVAYSLGMSVLPERLNTILRAQNLPAGWVAAILDSTGTIVGRNISPEKFLGNKATAPLLRALTQSQEGSIEATSQEGIPVQTIYSRSSATNWSVAIGIPRQSLHQAMMLSLVSLAAGVSALFAIGLILAWLMGGRIARSVRALTVPATALGRGEVVQAPLVHFKEAAEVGAALVHADALLHQRAAALHARDAELAQVHTRLRDVVDNAPALIYLKDLSGNFLLVNKTYERLIGAAPSQFRITKEGLWKAPQENQPSDADLHVLQSGGGIQFEEKIDTAEGSKYFAVSKAPLRNHNGELVGICAAAVDVTSLKIAEAQIRDLVATLEKRVEQRTGELGLANEQLLQVNGQLQEANSQLEAFSYTVAHDLRAPLRGIQGFADILVEDYEDKLDDTGRDYLHRISKAAGRMEQLIDDLLSFSRLARMELVLGAVSLDEVFRQVLADLDVQIRESHANVEISPNLPSVWANKSACLQVFQNLVSNAIKFSKPNTASRIRAWAETFTVEHTESKFVRIWIEDNGIGIPAAQQQRIFKPFERLHGMSEYPGSGIGLAIVETAARRMHGRCGLESEINAGSRFWIELPALTAERSGIG